jgi:Fe-S-cluster-containing dehydrogenase component
MEKWIVFHAQRCIQCHSCEIACQLENDAPAGLPLRWVKSFEEGNYPSARCFFISIACFHCNDPSCAAACPAGALVRRNDGVVAHLQEKCVGCGYCIQACPFHVPRFSATHRTMRKCSFCTQRIDRGLEPACVAKCTTRALEFYTQNELPPSLDAYGKAERLHMVYRLANKPEEYQLPYPIPGNIVAAAQVIKWLFGLIPGLGVALWLWKKAEAFSSQEVRRE